MKPYNRLVAELDLVFGKWVKLTNQVAPGVCQCITCKGFFAIQDIQAGHFMPRGYFATRWTMMNVKPQCDMCNGPLRGDPRRFEEALIEKYGKEAIDLLKSQAVMDGERHAPREWLERQIKEYKAKIKEYEQR